MPSHNNHGPHDHSQEEIDTSLGYEKSDVKMSGIVVFMASMAVFVLVTAVLCYGIGSMINSHMNKEDGPTNKWSQNENIRELGNMPSNPAMQDKVSELMQKFPAPRLAVDNGNEDISDLDARENLLLDHYTWIDQSKGTVRIPVERAMEVIAQQGLPVAPPSKNAPLMTGDSRPSITMPLTNGYAPTTYEQEQAAAAAVKEGREPGQ